MIILIGTKKLEPLTYELETEKIKVRGWFRTYEKEQYWIVCAYARLGPYNEINEAMYYLHMARSLSR